MDNFKVKIDQPELSDADILKHKNFGNVMKGVAKAQPPWYKTGKFWGLTGGGVAVAAITIATVVSLNSNQPSKPSIADESSTAQIDSTARPLIAELVTAPFTETDIPFETFLIDPSVDNEIITAENTVIYIPAGSLVNHNGQPLSSQTEISFRDFYNQYEMVAAGIPMEYDSSGVKGHLVSDGMFEIRGSKETNINQHKPIQVYFNSLSDDPKFNQYSMDENGWKFENANQFVEVDAGAEAIPTFKFDVLKPAKKTPGSHTFNVKIDLNKNPELENLQKSVFQVDESKEKFNTDLYHVSWSKIEFQDCLSPGYYKVALSNNDTTVYVTGTPVLEGEAYEQAIAKYEADLAKEKATFDVKNKDVLISRSDNPDAYYKQALAGVKFQSGRSNFNRFVVNTFGYFNCDFLPRLPAQSPKNYEVETPKNEPREIARIHVLPNNSNSIMTFNSSSMCLSNVRNKRFVFITEDEIAILSSNDISNQSNTVQLSSNHFKPFSAGMKELADIYDNRRSN